MRPHRLRSPFIPSFKISKMFKMAPQLLLASWMASQFLMGPVLWAESVPITNPNFTNPVSRAKASPGVNGLHERLVRKSINTPMITTRSLIDLPRRVNEAEFRITAKNGQNLNALKFPLKILENQRQKVTQRDGTSLQLQVRKYTPPDTLQEFPITTSEQGALKSGPWINHETGALSIQAKQLTQGQIYAYQASKILQQWVYKNIQTTKNHAHPQPASETMSTRSGNALEKAILLAAMCRSLGIPARIASGVEFSELGDTGIGGFKYHTWTETFVGEWVPFDPSHDDFLVDATHIKLMDTLYDSSQSPDEVFNRLSNQMSQMNIEVLRAEADGSTEVSLTGRAVENARIKLPEIDILHRDIQNQTQELVRQFTLTPTDNILNLKPNESLFTYGTEQLLEGKINEARHTFKTLSRKRLSQAIEHYSLGEKLAGLGLFTLAQQEFNQAAQQDPSLRPHVNNWQREYFPPKLTSESIENTYIRALSMASQISKDATQFSTTERLLRDVIQKAPRFSPAYLQLGQLYFSEGYFEPAETAYAQFKQIHPEDPRGYLGAGLLAMEQAHYAQALDALNTAHEKVSLYHSPQSYRLSRDIDNWTQMAEGRLALKEHPKNESKKAVAWLDIGQALFEQGRIKEALSAYQNALVFQPNSTLAKLSILELYLSQGDRQKGHSLFEELQTAHFSTPEAQGRFHRLNGYTQMRNRSYAEAEKALKQALQINPGDVDNYLVLAQIYRRQGKTQMAIEQMQEGIQNVPTLSDKNRLSHLLANELIDSEPAEAKRLLNALLLEDPSNPENYRRLGKIALNAQDLSTARSRFFQSYLLSPDDPDNLTDLATLYYREGLIEEAMTYYQRALRVDPGHYRAATGLNELIEEYDFRIDRPTRIVQLSTDEYDYLVDFFSMSQQTRLQLKAVYGELADLLQNYSKTNAQSVKERHESIPLLQTHYDIIKSGIKKIESTTPPGRFNQYHYQSANMFQSNLEFAKLLQENVPLSLSQTNKIQFITELARRDKQFNDASKFFKKTTEEIFNMTDSMQVSAIFMEAGYDTDPNNKNRLNPHEKNMKRFMQIILSSMISDTTKPSNSKTAPQPPTRKK